MHKWGRKEASQGSRPLTIWCIDPLDGALRGKYAVACSGPKLDCGILQVLRAAFPDHALMGEEGGVSGNPSSDYLWCIDPLDGTTNYTHKYPSFACSVAVLEKAEAVAGVVVEFAGGPGTWIQRTYTGMLQIVPNQSIMQRHCPRSLVGCIGSGLESGIIMWC